MREFNAQVVANRGWAFAKLEMKDEALLWDALELEDAEATALARSKAVHVALIVAAVLGAGWSGSVSRVLGADAVDGGAVGGGDHRVVRLHLA